MGLSITFKLTGPKSVLQLFPLLSVILIIIPLTGKLGLLTSEKENSIMLPFIIASDGLKLVPEDTTEYVYGGVPPVTFSTLILPLILHVISLFIWFKLPEILVDSSIWISELPHLHEVGDPLSLSITR